METKSHYQFLDQALALEIDLDTQTLNCLTLIRVKINSPVQNKRFIQLNAKQFQITDFQLINSSIYHPIKQKYLKENIDSKLTKKLTYIDPKMQQNIYQNIFKQNCPHNTHHLEDKSAKYQNMEDNSLITIYWDIIKNEKIAEKLDKIYHKGYFIYFTLQIKTRIINPQGPASFQVFQNSLFFLKNCQFGSSRNIFPCKDQINSYYHFSSLKISIKGENFQKYSVIASGKRTKVQSTDQVKTWIFQINRIINPNFLGIVVGQLYCHKPKQFVTNIWVLPEQSNWIVQNSNEITLSLKKHEKYLFSYDDEGDMILIPGLIYWNIDEVNDNYLNNEISPYYFYNFFIINEEFFLKENFLEATPFYYGQIFKYKFLMNTLEHLKFESINGFWILVGTCGYIIDKLIHNINNKSSSIHTLYEKRQQYFQGVQEGLDQHPLNYPHFFSPNQIYFDEFYSLKSNIVINLISSIFDLEHKTFQVMFWFLSKDLVLSTKNYFRKVKKYFNFKGLNKKLSYVINKTGSMRININYQYNRKTNQIDIFITQFPLIVNYFSKNNDKRFQQEKNFDILTPSHKLVHYVKKEFQEKVKKYRRIFLDKIENELNSIILVNDTWQTMKIFKQTIQYLLIESSDRNYTDKCSEIELDDNEKKMNIKMNTKMRKNNNNKKNNQDKNDCGSVIEKISKAEAQSVFGGTSTVINKLNIEGGETFSFKLIMDPTWKFLVKFVIYESEEVLISQFEKAVHHRKEFALLLDILDSMKLILNQNIMNKFCDYLISSDYSEYLKIQILKTFQVKPEAKENSRIGDIIGQLIQDLKIDEDGTLKMEKFEKIEKLQFFCQLIKYSIFHDNQKKELFLSDDSAENDDNLIELILTLLQKNDNSINKLDDTFYQAFIIKCLLTTKNSRFFHSVSEEILRYIKIEYYNKTKSLYIITTIIKHFSTYVLNNMKLLHYTLNPSSNKKFSLLEIFTENESLKSILNYFRKLLKIYKKHPLIGCSIFQHKLLVKKKIKGYKFIDQVIYGIKYIRKQRKRYGSIMGNNLLKELYNFIQKNKTERDKINRFSMKDVNTLVTLLWGQATCNLSQVDPHFKYYFMKIYEAFFDHYVPITLIKKEPNALFPIDRYWLEINNRLDLEKFFNKEKKNVVFKYLSLQKKTKKGLIKAQSQDHKYRIRDLLYQHFKVNKETITKRNIAKHIVNILLIEKITMNIENKTQEYLNGESDQVLRTNVYSMKDIKKKLVKQDIGSLEDLKYEIYCIVDSFRINNFIDDEIYKEYINFVNLLISEAESILKEKQETEQLPQENLNSQYEEQMLIN